MDVRKLAMILCVAASCAGCITEQKTIEIPPEELAKLKGIKITEATYPKRDAQPMTWVALGRLKEGGADDAKVAPLQQNQLRDEARKAYQKALEIDPHCVDAHLALAGLYAKQEDYDRALATYKSATKLNPKAAPLWYEEGVIYCQRKDFNNALVCLGKAHELDPQDRHLATQYGLCLARAGRHQDALTVLCRVMSKADANYNVARMMGHINQPELSHKYLTVALQERPTHTGALQMMAQLERQTNDQAPSVATTPEVDPNLRRASATLDGPPQ